MLAKKVSFQVYFADAYASWQCRCNENGNGLLFLKKTNFDDITLEEINDALHLINNRPRNCFKKN